MKQKRKKTLSTTERACQKISGFRNLLQKLDVQVRISGMSECTLRSYSNRLAALSLYFGKLPQDLSESEVNHYLAELTQRKICPSISHFKFTVYGLRFCYRALGMESRNVQLPQLKQTNKLPVVLNYKECKAMFSAPTFLKHRVILALMYSAGLRAGEVRRLKLADIDSGRMMIHIRQSKNKKDRYVPLSPLILEGLRKYLKEFKPVEYLFNGNKKGEPISMTGVWFAFGKLKKKCRINKKANLHTLRHSYATHLLEFGMDIVSIKELLGHSRIDTTMVYLHVAKPERLNLFSPFDKLYGRSKKQSKWYGS